MRERKYSLDEGTASCRQTERDKKINLHSHNSSFLHKMSAACIGNSNIPAAHSSAKTWRKKEMRCPDICSGCSVSPVDLTPLRMKTTVKVDLPPCCSY